MTRYEYTQPFSDAKLFCYLLTRLAQKSVSMDLLNFQNLELAIDMKEVQMLLVPRLICICLLVKSQQTFNHSKFGLPCEQYSQKTIGKTDDDFRELAAHVIVFLDRVLLIMDQIW